MLYFRGLDTTSFGCQSANKSLNYTSKNLTFLFQNCHRQSAGVQAAPCWSRRSIKYTLVNFCQLFGNHEPNISA